jgi:hypothetical protein
LISRAVPWCALAPSRQRLGRDRTQLDPACHYDERDGG